MTPQPSQKGCCQQCRGMGDCRGTYKDCECHKEANFRDSSCPKCGTVPTVYPHVCLWPTETLREQEVGRAQTIQFAYDAGLEAGYAEGIGSQSERKQQMFLAGRAEAYKLVREYVEENRHKVERMDRYVLDDLLAKLESNGA